MAAKLHAIVVLPVPPLYEWKAMHWGISYGYNS
jgi:hypothetical protein